MKKISLVMLSVVTGMAVWAQNQPTLKTAMEVKPRFGIIAGVNLPTLELDDDGNAANAPETNSKTSFHAGLVYNIPLSENFRFEPGIVYNGMGSKIQQAVGSSTQNYEYDFHYLSLPLRFQYQSAGGFVGELFPQISLLMKAQQDGPGSTEVDLKDLELVKKTDFGFGGGIGYVSRIGLGIAANYYWGLSNINNNDSNPGGNEKLTNRAITIGLRYYPGANK